MSRRKVSIPVSELCNPDVNFVSIVDRGAMRTPFKIFKKENGMLNLEKLFFTQKSEPAPAEAVTAPEVVSFVVAKREQADAFSTLLQEKGFAVIKADTETGVLTIKEDAELDGAERTVIKLSEDLAVVLTNVKKDFYGSAEGTTFTENVKTSGFYPGLHLAFDVLYSTIYKCVDEAGETVTDLGGTVGTAIDEFRAYVVGLCNAIPQTAFKAENLTLPEPVAAEVVKEDEPEPPADGGSDTSNEEDAAGGDAVAKSEDTVAAGADDFAAKMSSAMESITKSILGSLQPQLQELTTKFDEGAIKISELSERLESVAKTAETAAEVAQKAEEAAVGTLVGNTPAPEAAPVSTVKREQSSLYASALKFDGFE